MVYILILKSMTMIRICVINSQYTTKDSWTGQFERITNNTVHWIVQNSLPFSIVDSPEFKRFFAPFDEDYNMSSRRTIVRRMKLEYDSISAWVVQYFKIIHADVSFSCDE